MKTTRYIGAVMAALSLMTASSAMAAAPVRPVSTLGSGSIQGIQRASTPISDNAQNIFGAPIFLIFGGAIFITAFIVIVRKNNDSPTSPA